MQTDLIRFVVRAKHQSVYFSDIPICLDSIAASLFVWIWMSWQSIRQQDPNIYSDTEARCLVPFAALFGYIYVSQEDITYLGWRVADPLVQILDPSLPSKGRTLGKILSPLPEIAFYIHEQAGCQRVDPGNQPLDLRNLCLDLGLNLRREHWCSIFLCYLDMVKYFIHIVRQLTKVRQACINYPKFTPPNSWRHPRLSALLILLIFRAVFVRTM